jgi:hypothetical protein
MSTFDSELIANLRKTRQELMARINELYNGGHGCTCDQDALCAFHAQVNNYLVEAVDALDLALETLDSEGPARAAEPEPGELLNCCDCGRQDALEAMHPAGPGRFWCDDCWDNYGRKVG